MWIWINISDLRSQILLDFGRRSTGRVQFSRLGIILCWSLPPKTYEKASPIETILGVPVHIHTKYYEIHSTVLGIYFKLCRSWFKHVYMASLTRRFTMGGCDVQFRRAAEMAHPWKGQARLGLPRNGPNKYGKLREHVGQWSWGSIWIDDDDDDATDHGDDSDIMISSWNNGCGSVII